MTSTALYIAAKLALSYMLWEEAAAAAAPGPALATTASR
jgi:hypothetical protein